MNRISDFKYGRMMYSDQDRYVGKCIENYGEYCEEETILFKQLISDGDTVLDIGANIGASTIPMSQFVGSGKVISFEPQVPIFNMLCGNIALNNIYNTRAYCLAVGSNTDTLYFDSINYEEKDNFGGKSLKNEGKTPVSQVVLDEFVNEKVDFIKIDVENMELEVIKGAEGLIRKHSPILFFENDRPNNSHELLKFVDSLGYDMYWHKSGLYPIENYKKNQINVFDRTYICINVLAVKKEVNIKDLVLEKITDFSKWIKL